MPKEAKASLGKARQVVHLTGKVNFPYSRLAGGLALQDRRKRFNQRFPNDYASRRKSGSHRTGRKRCRTNLFPIRRKTEIP